MDPVSEKIVWPPPEKGDDASDIGNLATYRGALQQPPQPIEQSLYAAAMEVISSWSFTEMSVIHLFSSIIGADEATSGYAFSDVYNLRAIRDYIRSAAKSKLHQEDQNLISSLMELMQEVYDYRNHFAHGIFLFTVDRSGCLIVIKSKYLHRISADLVMRRMTKGLTKDCTIYKLEDLIRIREACENLKGFTDHAVTVIRSQLHRAPNEQILDVLFHQPHIGLILGHKLALKNLKKSQEVQKKSRKKSPPSAP